MGDGNSIDAGRRVNVSELKVGMVLARTVYTKDLDRLFMPGREVDRQTIGKLKKWDIEEVYVRE